MGLRINTNVAALNAQRNLSRSQSAFAKSLSRLSSGFRINQAADDSAGLSIANKLRAQVGGLRAASRNASQATAFGQTAEGAANEIANILNRLRELAVQSASDQNDSAARTALNNERSELESEVDRIAAATDFNGVVLVNGGLGVSVSSSGTSVAAAKGISDVIVSGASASTRFTISGANSTTIGLTGASGTQTVTFTAPSGFDNATVKFDTLGITLKLSAAFGNGSSFNITGTPAAATKNIVLSAGSTTNFQVGANQGTNNRIGLSATNLNLNTSGLSVTGDLLSQSNANTYLGVIDTAITSVNTALGDLGAFQNRLGFASANLATAIENTAAAESIIRDADIAAETTAFTKNQILVQASVSILAQANVASQSALSLIG